LWQRAVRQRDACCSLVLIYLADSSVGGDVRDSLAGIAKGALGNETLAPAVLGALRSLEEAGDVEVVGGRLPDDLELEGILARLRLRVVSLGRAPDRDEDVRTVFDAWLAHFRAHGQWTRQTTKLTKKRAAAIKARLQDGYSSEDLGRAIDGCSRSSWHMGENPDGKNWTDIELICRDSEHVDRFMQLVDDDEDTNVDDEAHRRTLRLIRGEGTG
jgi:hypothetical protein